MRIRVTFSKQSTVSLITDYGTNSKGCSKDFLTVSGLLGPKLLSKIILCQEIIIERLWACETQARLRVILLARAQQG